MKRRTRLACRGSRGGTPASSTTATTRSRGRRWWMQLRQGRSLARWCSGACRCPRGGICASTRTMRMMIKLSLFQIWYLQWLSFPDTNAQHSSGAWLCFYILLLFVLTHVSVLQRTQIVSCLINYSSEMQHISSY
uniref:Uncharacterized protein n=1 Tax=Arundo donax TaxID=35708 RepID=A0A0A9EH68_ARUDO